jgi:hypothetical protein
MSDWTPEDALRRMQSEPRKTLPKTKIWVQGRLVSPPGLWGQVALQGLGESSDTSIILLVHQRTAPVSPISEFMSSLEALGR